MRLFASSGISPDNWSSFLRTSLLNMKGEHGCKQSGKVETLNDLTNVLFILRCVTTSGMLSCKRQLANLVILASPFLSHVYLGMMHVCSILSLDEIL